MRFGRFSGAHYEMGLQHGRTFRDLLHKCKQGLEASSDARIARFESALSRLAPELVEEMKGIAEGAGMVYEDVVRLNFAEEIGAGCSQVGLGNGNGGAIMGKNEDAGFYRTYVVTELHPERGYAQLHVGAVNWVVSSGSGINEAGLCIGQSSLRITDQAEGVPRLTLLRLALERCATVAEAITFFQGHDAAIRGINFLMADATGDMAVVERSPTRCVVRRPQNGMIWATNHAVDAQVAAVEERTIGSEPNLDERLNSDENTRRRFARLSDFAKKHVVEASTRETLENLMRLHGPGGLCQHDFMETTWSVIMVPRSRQLWLSDGPPCGNPFQLYSFDGGK